MMTDYHPLIARAVDGLDKSTGEARRALYDRARNALVTQLRSVEPALSEMEITKERLALEDAIRKVEAEAARKARAELRERQSASPPRRSEPAAAKPGAGTAAAEADAPRRAASLPSARERLLNARSSSPAREGVKSLRDVVSEVHDLGVAATKAAQSARDTRDSFGPPSFLPASRRDDHAASPHDVQPLLDSEELSSAYDGLEQIGDRLRGFALKEDEAAESIGPHIATAEDELQRLHPPRSYRGPVIFLVVLIILVGAAATVSWQWPHITGLYQRVTQAGSKQQSPAATAPSAQPKFSGRVPQESVAQAPAAAGAPGAQTAPAVAQRIVLYEEDPNDPQGKRYAGSAIWRTETVSPGPGLAPELAVRADLTIPERRMTMTFSLRRNTDQALPASHTIEVMFSLPADFPGGGVANVPGILMKQSEQARGTPLAGLAVKVTNGFFLIGLSAVDSDVQRNVQLLKERPWFDIPIVYTNGGRAILALEKGPPGDRSFAEAFAAWDKK